MKKITNIWITKRISKREEPKTSEQEAYGENNADASISSQVILWNLFEQGGEEEENEIKRWEQEPIFLSSTSKSACAGPLDEIFSFKNEFHALTFQWRFPNSW